MTPARFQTIEEIYRAALDREPDQVSAFLDKACKGDQVLRRKVEALLASRQRVGNLIEGETLRQRLMRGRMELSEAVDVAIQVASALTAAHEAGIVHRDINPGNIMLRRDGYVKVLDFGIAKLAQQEVPVTMPKKEALLLVETNVGLILGTVHYMSPEQALGAPVDNRTDIWSLGLVLYQMVTGRTPLICDTARGVMTSLLEKHPTSLITYVSQDPAQFQQV